MSICPLEFGRLRQKVPLCVSGSGFLKKEPQLQPKLCNIELVNPHSAGGKAEKKIPAPSVQGIMSSRRRKCHSN